MNDLTLYDRHAADWWDARSSFSASLHEVNRILIADVLGRLGSDLSGMLIADLGCGGGLLAEPAARAGAAVIGIDLSRASLHAGRTHAATVPGLHWVQADIRAVPLVSGCADLVLCCDVLEHLREWRSILAGAARLLRPGGRLLATAINRTFRAHVLAVTLGEGLGLIPRGTHDPALFIRPGELEEAAGTNSLMVEETFGLQPGLMSTLVQRRLIMRKSADRSVLYAYWFKSNL